MKSLKKLVFAVGLSALMVLSTMTVANADRGRHNGRREPRIEHRSPKHRWTKHRKRTWAPRNRSTWNRRSWRADHKWNNGRRVGQRRHWNNGRRAGQRRHR